MIRGVHTMFYTADAEGTRAFLRDKLGLPVHRQPPQPRRGPVEPRLAQSLLLPSARASFTPPGTR